MRRPGSRHEAVAAIAGNVGRAFSSAQRAERTGDVTAERARYAETAVHPVGRRAIRLAHRAVADFNDRARAADHVHAVRAVRLDHVVGEFEMRTARHVNAEALVAADGRAHHARLGALFDDDAATVIRDAVAGDDRRHVDETDPHAGILMNQDAGGAIVADGCVDHRGERVLADVHAQSRAWNALLPGVLDGDAVDRRACAAQHVDAVAALGETQAANGDLAPEHEDHGLARIGTDDGGVAFALQHEAVGVGRYRHALAADAANDDTLARARGGHRRTNLVALAAIDARRRRGVGNAKETENNDQRAARPPRSPIRHVSLQPAIRILSESGSVLSS